MGPSLHLLSSLAPAHRSSIHQTLSVRALFYFRFDFHLSLVKSRPTAALISLGFKMDVCLKGIADNRGKLGKCVSDEFEGGAGGADQTMGTPIADQQTRII